MASRNKSLPRLVTTGVVLTAISCGINADETPFRTDVFHVASYQVADLDEEACGGAMTEYKVDRGEDADKKADKPRQDEPTEATDKESEDDKPFSFWSWLFG
jgi:hypothetical protein